jgi:DNA-directed RNA polymerase subunit beta'
MEKSYVTDNSLAYKIFVEEGADVSSAKLTLYKFNEETLVNEVVSADDYNFTCSGQCEILYDEDSKTIKFLGAGEYDILYQGVVEEIDGVIDSITPEKDSRFTIVVKSEIDSKSYLTDSGKKPSVSVGDTVKAGDLIVDGMIHPKELLRVANVAKVEQYIVKEVQKVYRAQGVDISDKHVEIIVKQMLQKAIVVHEGDTNLLPGTFISRSELYQVIKETLAKGKRIPVVKPVILGITRASLKADSFLSAASFQETTRVLTEAAIRGKIDRLEGLKENIIIGGLIPAGTGLVDEVNVEPENLDATLYEVPKL